MIKHNFSHFHSFTVCLYSDSAIFWGLKLTSLGSTYCCAIAQPCFYITGQESSSQAKVSTHSLLGLGSSRDDYELYSHRPAKCSERHLSPWHPWQRSKSMESLSGWDQQILCGFLFLCRTGALGFCCAPSCSRCSQHPS